MHKSDGCYNKKQQCQPYDEHDNDYYWFNHIYKRSFFVVPEQILINKGYISTDDSYGKTSFDLTLNMDWLDRYQFDYETINETAQKNKLLKLLNIKNGLKR